MVVNILASHRFHLLDLARELSNLRHDVRFYSYVPAKRCAEFGLDKSMCISFLWLVWPFFVFAKIAPKVWQDSIVWYRNLLIDWFVSRTMRKCDVCIGIGTVYIKAFETAKKNGATTILEWGSKHIEEQIKQFGRQEDYSVRTMQRELHQYDLCNYISIPTTHVKESFLKHGIPDSKLVMNPYGVDLSEFHPTSCSNEFDLIYVGGWRYEKGCDLLTELCERYGYKLLHVGALVNLDFPKVSNMTHQEPVDQKELVNYYAKARVFVLPSRAEGLALVQAQAIVCGLPVVCSKETGGVDLREQLADKKWIIEMEDLSVEALLDAVDKGLNLARMQRGKRNYAGEGMKRLSWENYGARYSEKLIRIR